MATTLDDVESAVKELQEQILKKMDVIAKGQDELYALLRDLLELLARRMPILEDNDERNGA